MQMQLVSCMGGLWSLSNVDYKRLLNDIARGKEYDLVRYGKFLGYDLVNVTDMGQREAKERLRDMKKKKAHSIEFPYDDGTMTNPNQER
jgi:hypothetical protein